MARRWSALPVATGSASPRPDRTSWLRGADKSFGARIILSESNERPDPPLVLHRLLRARRKR